MGLGLWTVWLVGSRVTIYATTPQARLEVDRENHPIDSPVAGRVISAPIVAGRTVKAGDILIELDANIERLAQGEAIARLEPADDQIRSLRDELRATQDALSDEERSATAAKAEAEAKAQEAAAAAEFAAEESRRLGDLQKSGLVSELEALRARKTTEEREGELRSATFALGRVTRDLDARRQDRLARVARLRNEIAAIEGTRGGAAAASERLGYEISQRQLRAPISGVVAEVSSLRVGSVVPAGARICTIVPDGNLKVIAFFEPSMALGRVFRGQPARVRLNGFPWTQFGSTPAEVAQVAGEVRDGRVRVELTLAAGETAIPLQHGLPAEVDVAVERTSPLNVVLRSVGARLRTASLSPTALSLR